MKGIRRFGPIALICGVCLLFGAGTGLAQKPGKHAGKVPAKAVKTKTHVAAAGRVLGKAETLSGVITSVDADQKMVVLTSSSGVPYDLKVTRKTRIKVASQKADWGALAGQLNKPASVEFVPTSSGNFARSVDVGGQ